MSREDDLWDSFSERHERMLDEHEKASRWVVLIGVFGLFLSLTLLGLLGWLVVWTVQQFTN